MDLLVNNIGDFYAELIIVLFAAIYRTVKASKDDRGFKFAMLFSVSLLFCILSAITVELLPEWSAIKNDKWSLALLLTLVGTFVSLKFALAPVKDRTTKIEGQLKH